MEYKSMANIFHILPLNDSEEHEEFEYCGCNPIITWISEDYALVIHNSFDHREDKENLLRGICLN